jgi:hypothetical protein
MELTYQEWEEKYGYADEAGVPSKDIPIEYIWSEVEYAFREKVHVLLPGYHGLNNINYYIAKRPRIAENGDEQDYATYYPDEDDDSDNSPDNAPDNSPDDSADNS